MVRTAVLDLFCETTLPYIRVMQQNQTATLEVGARAPEFSLIAANHEGNFLLSSMLGRGPVIIEFLRGTW
jgi:hypothetical protein